MTEGAIVGYVGAVCGIVGTVTGVLGAFWGYRGYRAANEIKGRDLRLELRKDVAALRRDLVDLPNFLMRAHDSRVALRNAQGVLKAGAMERWRNELRVDSQAAGEFPAKLKPDEHYAILDDHQQLEEASVEVHALRDEAQRLRDKYAESLADDTRQRAAFQADQRAIERDRMRPSP